MIALLTFLLFGSYTRRINVSGEVTTEPHTINLFAPEQGVISRLLVTNGQRVMPGTPLYQLDVSQVTRSGNVTATTLPPHWQPSKSSNSNSTLLSPNCKITNVKRWRICSNSWHNMSRRSRVYRRW